MANYLETNYLRDEYGEEQYPQKLCNYIVDEIILKDGDLSGKKILDIGSGRGSHLVGFDRRGLHAFGLDKRKECIEALDSFDIRECDLETESIPFEDNYFDYIYSKSVIEHVYNSDNFLSETLRILKPGGKAIIMCPDWGSQYKTFWDDYTHVRPWTRKSLQNALRINYKYFPK